MTRCTACGTEGELDAEGRCLFGHDQLASGDQPRTEVVPAIAAGVLSALAGGLAWAAVAIATGHDYGIAAWALGALTGAVVARFAHAGDVRAQAIAVGSCLLAIAIRKYVIFVHVLKDFVTSKYDAAVAARISWMSIRTASVFFGNIIHLVNGFDALWIALAAITAFRVVRRKGTARSTLQTP